ncbi:hypothetical protein SFRURICE_009296 [Spodoptera frugiperda]|nr:hypothetical protein SFRURICE_009296 [Spodoptera frugiperda]
MVNNFQLQTTPRTHNFNYKIICTRNHTLKHSTYCLIGRVASATAGKEVSDSIPRSSKVLLGLFRFFKNVSVVAQSLKLCLEYGNRLTPYYMGLITLMVKSGISYRNVQPLPTPSGKGVRLFQNIKYYKANIPID